MIAQFIALAITLTAQSVSITPEIPDYILEEHVTMFRAPNQDLIFNLQPDDIELICRCVMSEAGSEPIECQEGVTDVIINRLCSPRYPNDIKEIIVPGQFSTSDNGDITEEVRLSVMRAIEYYGTCSQVVPYNCYYFRAGHYHNFGIPYKHIGNTYFSLSEEATD